MHYSVHFVDDTALPEGVEWTFVRQAGETLLFVKRPAVDQVWGRCDALTRAWEVWQTLEAEEPSRTSRVRSEVGRIRVATAVLLAGYGITMLKVGSAVI